MNRCLSRFCALVNSFESRRLVKAVRRPPARSEAPHYKHRIDASGSPKQQAPPPPRNSATPILVAWTLVVTATHTAACDAPSAPDPTSRDDDNRRSGGGERKELPEDLSRNVMKLECESSAEGGICQVYVIGTQHDTEESRQRVEAVINYLKPQVVFLELCLRRVAGASSPKNDKTKWKMLDVWRTADNPVELMFRLVAAKAINVWGPPRSEFLVAFEEAQKYRAKVVLGDRPYDITTRRMWTRLSLREKMNLLQFLVFVSLESDTFFASQVNTARSPHSFQSEETIKSDTSSTVENKVDREYRPFPQLKEVLVDERDQYMACTLLNVASEHNLVVAVVGMGHLQGIKKNWKKPIQIMDLLQVDMPKWWWRLSAELGVGVAGVTIIASIFLINRKIARIFLKNRK